MRMPIHNDDTSWPPAGWDSLKGITKTSGQSLIKDPETSIVRGISYAIQTYPLHTQRGELNLYGLRVDSWKYSIKSDSTELPILSMKIMERFDPHIPEEFYVSDIKVMACPVHLNERNANRALRVFRFLYMQIHKNNVPDVNRVMRLYKLHPLQLSAYSDQFGLDQHYL